jgi:hypothetical protein
MVNDFVYFMQIFVGVIVRQWYIHQLLERCNYPRVRQRSIGLKTYQFTV